MIHGAIGRFETAVGVFLPGKLGYMAKIAVLMRAGGVTLTPAANALGAPHQEREGQVSERKVLDPVNKPGMK
jgi:hypothetical protein